MNSRVHFDHWMKTLRDKFGDTLTLDEIAQQCYDFSNQEARKIKGDYNDQSEANAISTMAVGTFIDSGRQVFTLGSGISQMFMATSLSNVKHEDVKPPYRTFWVTIPRGTITAKSGRGECDILGFYVVFGDEYTGDGTMIVAYGDNGMLRWYPLALENTTRYGIEETVKGAWRYSQPEGSDGAVVMTRIAFNLMLYLSQETAEVATERRSADTYDQRMKDIDTLSIPKRQKLITRLHKKRLCRDHTVGASIDRVTGGVSSHWVRGHWHTYLCGKGRKDRRLQWVMPYQKGDGEERQGKREYAL